MTCNNLIASDAQAEKSSYPRLLAACQPINSLSRIDRRNKNNKNRPIDYEVIDGLTRSYGKRISEYIFSASGTKDLD